MGASCEFFLAVIGSCNWWHSHLCDANQYFEQTAFTRYRARKKEENIERLKIYSEILKLDGEKTLGDFETGVYGFNINLYKREFRPVFFSKFYLLHQEIAELIRYIDVIIFEVELGVYFGDEKNDLIMNKFNEIIERIESHLKEYRT